MRQSISILLTLLLFACEKVDVPVYDAGKPSLNFVKNFFLPGTLSNPELDTLRVHAAYHTGKSKAECKIPLSLSGRIAAYDRKYTLRINPTESYGNLQEEKHFTLPVQQLFHAGKHQDSLVITLHLDPLRQDRAAGILTIELVPNENFIAGLESYQSIGIEISGGDFLREPYFWGLNKMNDYAGKYHTVKAEKFAELNRIPSPAWRGSSSQLYAYSKRAYEWFRDNPTYDETGKRIEFKGRINFE